MKTCDLKEAKAVVTQYHKYLSENSLVKTVPEETISLVPPKEGLVGVTRLAPLAAMASLGPSGYDDEFESASDANSRSSMCATLSAGNLPN
jgi:hypothetical protein